MFLLPIKHDQMSYETKGRQNTIPHCLAPRILDKTIHHLHQ